MILGYIFLYKGKILPIFIIKKVEYDVKKGVGVIEKVKLNQEEERFLQSNDQRA